MKVILAILLLGAVHCTLLAQNKNNVYVDVGLTTRGISATYDRKLVRHFDIGLGVNSYNFSDQSWGNTHSAIYLDFRPYWLIRKRSLLFMLVDIGVATNGGNEPINGTMSRYGLHTALGSRFIATR